MIDFQKKSSAALRLSRDRHGTGIADLNIDIYTNTKAKADQENGKQSPLRDSHYS
jgi:hypothetical protein